MAAAYIFGVEDVITNLGLASLFSSATGVEPQGFSPAINPQIATGMGNLGDILIDGSSNQAQTAYDIKQNFTINFCTNADAQSAITVKLGGAGTTVAASPVPYGMAVAALAGFGLYSHVVATGVSLSQPAAGFAKLSVTMHCHFFHATTGTPRQHIAQSYTIILPNYGWGLQSAPLCNASPSTPTLTLADFENYNFSAEVSHTDELDRSGKFLIGASHGAKLTESFTFTNHNAGTFGGLIQGQLFVPATNWINSGDARAPSNTNYEKRTITCQTFQAHD